MGEIARLELGAESIFNNSFIDGKPSIALYRQTGANAVDMINQANKTPEEISQRIPKCAVYVLGDDPTASIRWSISEIAEILVITLVLVVLVTFVFLQDWCATIVPPPFRYPFSERFSSCS